jgi:D-methionine transport system substrate-binding protein
MNNVVYRKEDLEKPFVAAIKKAYHSEEFLAYTNEHNASFVKPDYQKDQEGEK